MSESEDTISTFFMILSHPLRRLIIEALFEMKEVSFSELLRMFFIDNSTLNFHLKKLNGLIRQLPNKKYALTEMGQKAVEILQELKSVTLQSKVQSFQETVELLLAPTKKRILASLIDFLIGFGIFILLPLILAPLRWS
ncbi:MAG: helix-turn-helix transcriptional regulator, partial [Candidatus Brockarchaeota archaeon]|nr:helix-turn-helix transcriptional regulator [Candidatus Brockarchaeota archaeon]MBO3767912.1 helix-turn-helix transcriptional regulator [Candidatus Brockarchaeota archaeon]